MIGSVIILAGGKSSRMGKNKALLELRNGMTVIESIIEELSSLSEHVVIVTNQPEEYRFLQLPLIKDTWSEIGPLGGIHAGLRESPTSRNLIVACDMPFPSAEIGKYLLLQLDHVQAAVPQINEYTHPLFAAYRKDILSVIEEVVKENKRSMKQLLQKIQHKLVTETELERLGIQRIEKYFFNMNNPTDYQNALSIDKL
ncbi:molybdenum cofactor guanylyltransferase [Bacillus sp. 03113]|uniref:molybdenum cofactor guanylyltransferase n=1 Tax=Bacillus sp. 03113 TaxID=2578211 RepID=UPI001144BDA7|nr:molybdenum cofactor guanylyltransferase [Bacillus sp. 03113]